jgi:hypothetical protein
MEVLDVGVGLAGGWWLPGNRLGWAAEEAQTAGHPANPHLIRLPY